LADNRPIVRRRLSAGRYRPIIGHCLISASLLTSIIWPGSDWLS